MAEKKTVLEKEIPAGAGKNEKNGKAEKMEGSEVTGGSEETGSSEETGGSEQAEVTENAEGVERTVGNAGRESAAGTRRTENKFTKAQLLGAKRFQERRDIVDALLTDGEQYTIKAVEQKIQDYMKGRVK